MKGDIDHEIAFLDLKDTIKIQYIIIALLLLLSLLK